MRAFIDTSALVKKYIEEVDSEYFVEFLDKVSEITVAPTYWVEVCSVLDRCSTDKSLSPSQFRRAKKEALTDYHFFNRVIWSEDLEDKSEELISKVHLKALDSIQLGSFELSQADVFITADIFLSSAAKKISKEVVLIHPNKN